MTWSCRQTICWTEYRKVETMQWKTLRTIEQKGNEWKIEKGKREPREGDWCSHLKGLIASLSTLAKSFWRLDSWGCVCRPWRTPNSSVKSNNNKRQCYGKYTMVYCLVLFCFLYVIRRKYQNGYCRWETLVGSLGTRHDLCIFPTWHSFIGFDGTDVYILFCWLRNPKSLSKLTKHELTKTINNFLISLCNLKSNQIWKWYYE